MVIVAIFFADCLGCGQDEYEDNKLKNYHKVMSNSFDYDDLSDSQICEMMYIKTNSTMDNPLDFDEIKKHKLHTHLKIGDVIVIDRNKPDTDKKNYLCLSSGWLDLDAKPKKVNHYK